MSRVPKDLIRASAAERRESRCEAIRLFQINAGLLCFAPLRNFFPKSFPFDFTAASANPFVQLTGHSARRCYEKFMRKEM
ncbi:MAG: hypothetical protein ABIR24_12925, partial [Verrucomicrobiota bacterium]